MPLAGSGASLAEAARPILIPAAAGRVAVVAADLGPQADIVYAGPERAGINPLRMQRRVSVPPETFQTLAGLVDELQLVVAPFFVGDSRAPRFVGDGDFPWGPDNRATLAEVRQIGDVVLLRYALSDHYGQV